MPNKTLDGEIVTYRAMLGAVMEETKDRFGIEPDSVSAPHWSKMRRGLTGVTVDVLRRMFGAKRMVFVLGLTERGLGNLKRRGVLLGQDGEGTVSVDVVRRTAFVLVNPNKPV